MKFRDKENNHAGRIEGCVVSKDSQTIVSPLRGFRAPSFDPATIVTPLRGWGLPAFHPTKRNDRVILPADRSVAKVVVVPQTNITGLEITVSRDVSKGDRKRKQEARREVRLSEPRKVDRIYDQGLTGSS